MLTTLYLIRHAHPKQNTGIAYDRVPGPPLDAEGLAEAVAAAAYLTHCGLQALYVSPLDRTQQTADAIARATGLTAETHEALAEHRNGEAFDQVKSRMRAQLTQAESGAHTTLGFVTHGSPIKALLQILTAEKIDLGPYNFPGNNPAPTAGIWCATRTADGWDLALVFEPQRTTSG